jgi:hypothetical protein
MTAFQTSKASKNIEILAAEDHREGFRSKCDIQNHAPAAIDHANMSFQSSHEMHVGVDCSRCMISTFPSWHSHGYVSMGRVSTTDLAPSIWRCGVLPFNFVISSDHRGAFVDVDIDEFLGGDPSALMSAALRGIRSQSPKACVKCVLEMEEHMTAHNVCSRVASLSQQTTNYGLTACLKKKWEGVDQDILRACLHAEKMVTKKCQPPWSLALHQASLRATCWRIALSGERTHRAVNTVLEALTEQTDWDPTPPPLSMSAPDIQTQLRLVQAELKAIFFNHSIHQRSQSPPSSLPTISKASSRNGKR